MDITVARWLAGGVAALWLVAAVLAFLIGRTLYTTYRAWMRWR